MATIDIFLIVIIVSSALFGLIRGLIASALSLSGWILSFYLTFLTFPFIEPYLESKITNPFLLKTFGYSALLVIYLIIFGIINLALNIATKSVRGNVFNRILGLIFGIARGFVLVMLALFVYHINFTALHGINNMSTKIEEQAPEFYKKGKLAYEIAKYTDKAKSLISKDLNERINVFYDKLTNSSFEERFVEYAIIRLEKNLDPKIKSKIRDKLNASDDGLSKEKLDLMHLKLSYAEYNHLAKDDIRYPLTNEELDRIDSIVLGVKSSSLENENT